MFARGLCAFCDCHWLAECVSVVGLCCRGSRVCHAPSLVDSSGRIPWHQRCQGCSRFRRSMARTFGRNRFLFAFRQDSTGFIDWKPSWCHSSGRILVANDARDARDSSEELERSGEPFFLWSCSTIVAWNRVKTSFATYLGGWSQRAMPGMPGIPTQGESLSGTRRFRPTEHRPSACKENSTAIPQTGRIVERHRTSGANKTATP